MIKGDELIEEQLGLSSLSGAAPFKLPKKLSDLFPALSHRNFQLYFIGQTISLVGFWLYQVAVGWLAYELTKSPFWVGTTMAIGGLPFLLFTAISGVLIDKVDKQKFLVLTMSLEAIITFVLAATIFLDIINLPILITLVFLFGVVESADLPARLTFLVEMVGKKDLPSAVPINTGIFNTARFIGPAVAGTIIGTAGIAWPFLLNGISYLAGIWAIVKIKPLFINEADLNVHPIESLKQGIVYSFTHPKLIHFILLAFFTAIFIWPFQTLMPIVSETVFHTGAQGYGSLLSAAGLGSLSGAIYTSANSTKAHKIVFVERGIMLSSIGLILFSLNSNFLLAHLFLFISGAGTLMMISTLNTLVQLNSPDNMRARVMSVYLTMFLGMMPLGNALAGLIAEHTSAIFTIGLSGGIFLIIGLVFHFKGYFTKLSEQN